MSVKNKFHQTINDELNHFYSLFVINLCRTQGHQIPEENRYAILQPQLEINPKHPIIKKLFALKESNPELSVLLINQLFGNAMVGARLIDDAQILIKSINDLLTKALEKH